MKYVKNNRLRTSGNLMFKLTPVTALAMVITMLAVVTSATPASATGTCLRDQYGKSVQCSANDVSVAYADNPRDLQGNSLTGSGKGCQAGTMFSFIADYHIVTTATARENIGLYFQTAGGSSALTGGTCSDNIISPLHDPGQNTKGSCGSGVGQVPCLGSALYHEYDTSLTGDNCGDTTSADGTTQMITVEVDNALCKAGANGLLSLPNCTSWQQPGGALLCASSPPNTGWPWVPAAIPGSPSKCHCDSGFTVPIQVQTPGVSVTKSADKTSMNDPGGTVTYTVAVTNNKSNFGSVTLNQICDSAYGTIATVTGQTTCPAGILGLDGTATTTSCQLPATIALGSTFNCTFTANMTEQNSPVTDTATANGVGADGVSGFSTPSNSVTVTVNEAATTATTKKNFVSTQAGCATVRYSVDIHNSSSVDETLTLLASATGTPPIIALNDSQYGDVTKVQGNVLGTTCGLANDGKTYGLGTMASGLPGALLSTAGTLPATIAAGADYTCQFDAQFCGALSSVTTSTGTCNGIQQMDTITPALLDDEGNTFTNTSNKLTISECFQPDVQSQ